MARGCLTCVPTKISPNDFQEKYTNDDENGFYKFDKTENMTELNIDKYNVTDFTPVWKTINARFVSETLTVGIQKLLWMSK